MPGITLTYAARMSEPARALHAGANTLPWSVNTGTVKFGTLSDVLLLGKIPNGALIYNQLVNLGPSGAAAIHVQLQLLVTEALGSFSVFATLIASMTASVVAQAFMNTVPFKLSLSDDRAVQFAVLALNVSTGASGTTSFLTQGSVSYLRDGTVL